MDTIQDRVGHVKAESDKLGRFLESLSGQNWEQPSACDGWTVADVVAHLIGGAEMFTEHISRGLRGDKKPPDGFPAAGEADPEVLGNLNAMRTVFRRAGLGDRLLPTFKATDNQMNQLFAGIRPGDWDRLCYHPAAEFPVRTFLSLRMFELALHGWDITSRLHQSEPTLSAESFPMLMELISAMCPGLVQPTAGHPPGDRYRFNLSGIASGHYDIVLKDTGARLEVAARLEVGADGPADVVFRCSAAHFLLVMTGRLSVDSAIDDGRLVVEVGRWLPPNFSDWFKGVWRPSNR